MRKATSPPMPRVLIVGAGLTGATLAHRLAAEGVESVLLERAAVPGGLIRSEHMEGVLYEPHGSHIFHTEDTEVWELANAMTPFNDYRHRVDIVVDGGIYNWPILVSDIDAQSRSEEIHAAARRAQGRGRRRARPGGELRGVVPGADGPGALRALHQALHREAVGPPGARAVGAVGAAAGVGAPGRRPLPVPRPLPGLARGAQRLHGPDRRPARPRADRAAHRRRRDARRRSTPTRGEIGRDRAHLPARRVRGRRASAAWTGAGSSCAACTCPTSSTPRARWS